MNNQVFLAILSVIAISLVSLVGILTLLIRKQKIHDAVMYIVAFSAGAMLGDVFIHLLPELAEEAGFSTIISLYILVGIVATFILEKAIHWHHGHTHDKKKLPHPVTMITLVGDGAHNFIDGVAVAASYLVSVELGIATTIAVVLHEIPQEIGNFAVLVHGGFGIRKALFFNFLSALTAIAGAVVTLSISATAGVVTFLTAATAGNFIYIAAVDLIPEIHKESGTRQSFLQIMTFIAGIAVMYALTLLE